MPLPDLLRPRIERVVDLTQIKGGEPIRLRIVEYPTVDDLVLHAIEAQLGARVRGEAVPAPIDADMRSVLSRVTPSRAR